MGLDQYAYARKTEGNKEKKVDIQSWRKHANLEGWMSNLYESKGGTEEFNCVELSLDKDDLLLLLEEYLDLPPAEGFFWGESTPEDDEATRIFIERALELIEKGYEVIYTSWW